MILLLYEHRSLLAAVGLVLFLIVNPDHVDELGLVNFLVSRARTSLEPLHEIRVQPPLVGLAAEVEAVCAAEAFLHVQRAFVETKSIMLGILILGCIQVVDQVSEFRELVYCPPSNICDLPRLPVLRRALSELLNSNHVVPALCMRQSRIRSAAATSHGDPRAWCIRLLI